VCHLSRRPRQGRSRVSRARRFRARPQTSSRERSGWRSCSIDFLGPQHAGDFHARHEDPTRDAPLAANLQRRPRFRRGEDYNSPPAKQVSAGPPPMFAMLAEGCGLPRDLPPPSVKPACSDVFKPHSGAVEQIRSVAGTGLGALRQQTPFVFCLGPTGRGAGARLSPLSIARVWPRRTRSASRVDGWQARAPAATSSITTRRESGVPQITNVECRTSSRTSTRHRHKTFSANNTVNFESHPMQTMNRRTPCIAGVHPSNRQHDFLEGRQRASCSPSASALVARHEIELLRRKDYDAGGEHEVQFATEKRGGALRHIRDRQAAERDAFAAPCRGDGSGWGRDPDTWFPSLSM
jgi:hypothetical protein